MSHILEFLDLVDTPNVFSGFPNRPVKVNNDAKALEFGSVAAEYSALDTSDFDGIFDSGTTNVQLMADQLDDGLFLVASFFNGVIVETFDALVTESEGTVTLNIQASPTGDLNIRFSDGWALLDCTPAATINLTVGTDSNPTTNYIYVLQSTKALTKSTSNWPSEEHAKVAFLLVPSATEVGAEGCYINQNWNDHVAGTDDQGHLTHITETIRLTMGGANWHSGVAGNATAGAYIEITGTSPSVVEFISAAGVAYQMHKHIIPALDMSGANDCRVVNWNGDAYHAVSDLASITADSTGSSLSNKYFNLVFWGVANKTGEYSPLMCNLPNGSYVGGGNAIIDADGYDVTNIPHEFAHDSTTGFLICRLTCHQTPSGTWILVNTTDLRGAVVGAAAGAGTTGAAITDFADNQFTVYSVADDTKIVDFDLSTLTTGNTRTITPANADMTLLSTTQYTDLTDSGDTTLHGHDVTELTNWPTIDYSYVSGNDGATDVTAAEFETLTDTSDADALHTHGHAIHDNVASEISGISGVTAAATDVLILEDASNSWNKKRVTAQSIADLGGSGTDDDAIHDNVANEITGIATKLSIADADEFILEDGEASYIKKAVTARNLKAYVGGDDDAIHVNVANEITGITPKGLVAAADEIVIEDSAASYVKKAVTLTNLKAYMSPAGNDTTAIHDNQSNEITAITPITTLADADEFILEDASASYAKRAITAVNLKTYMGGGGSFLPLTAGSGSPLTGDLYIETSVDPAIYFREGGSETNYSRIRDIGTSLQIAKYAAGISNLLINLNPDDGTSSIELSIFRYSTTTGTRLITFHQGDGTAAIHSQFDPDNECIEFNAQGSTSSYIDCYNSAIKLNNNYGLISCAETDTSTYRNVLRMNTSNQVVFGNTNNVTLINSTVTENPALLRIDNNNSLNLRRYMNLHTEYVGTSVTGAMVLRPFGAAAAPAAVMLRFTIRGYQWDSNGSSISGAWAVIVGGYYTTSWNNAGKSAEVLYGNPPFDEVRLSRDASGYPAIVLGTTTTSWLYVTIAVDAMSSFSGADDWDATEFTYATDASLTSFTFDRTMYMMPGEYILAKNTTGVLLAANQICYISGSSADVPLITLADADAESTSKGMLVMTTRSITHNASRKVLIRGPYVTTGLTAGAVYYLSTTAGTRTTVAPSGTGDIVRVIGYGISTTRLWFDPDKTWVERI